MARRRRGVVGLRRRYAAADDTGTGANIFGPQFWSGVQSLGKQIGEAMAQKRKDAIANRLLNTRFAPRAGLVTDASGQGMVHPTQVGTAFTPERRAFIPKPSLVKQGIAGTAPATGGEAEIKMRMDVARLAREEALADAEKTRTANAIKMGPSAGNRSSWGNRGAGGGGGGGGGGKKWQSTQEKAPKTEKAAKPEKPTVGSMQDPTQYTMDNFRKDIDTLYGAPKSATGAGGAYEKMFPYFDTINTPLTDDQLKPENWKMNAEGKVVGPTGFYRKPDGGLIFYEDGKRYANITPDQAYKLAGRYNAATSNLGMKPINFGNIPTVGGNGPPGSMANPYKLNKGDDQFAAYNFPPGSFYEDQNGNVRPRQSQWERDQAQQQALLAQGIENRMGATSATSSVPNTAYTPPPEPIEGGVSPSYLGKEEGPSGYGASAYVARGGAPPTSPDLVTPSTLPVEAAPQPTSIPGASPTSYLEPLPASPEMFPTPATPAESGTSAFQESLFQPSVGSADWYATHAAGGI